MTPNDKLILDSLTHRLPEEWETNSEYMAKFLFAMRPYLIRHVASFNRLRDVENFVDEIIWAAFKTYHAQYLGKNVRMPYSDQYADRVDDLLKGWLLAMIGKPFSGPRSGKITNAIRKQEAEDDSSASVEIEGDLEQDVTDNQEHFTVEEARAKVGDVLRKLPSKKEFVFRINTGLHDQERLSPDAIVQIARFSRMDEKSCKYIKSIAKEMLDDGFETMKLDQSKTGKLVAINERRVRTIVSEARAALESARLI